MTAIHIVTPFSRPEYFPFLKANLAQADSWTLLVTPGQAADFSHQIPHPLTVVDGFPEGSDICYAKVNAWIVGHASNIRDEDYYQFMCDDDALPTGVLPTLKSRDEDIIVISCKRGDQVPQGPPPHPTWPLYAAPENMSVSKATWEQAVIKGKILKTLRFNSMSATADGEMMADLHAIHGPRIKYLPDLFLKFNYLQPGRWHERSHESGPA